MYNYQNALRGEGLAAPAPTTALDGTSSDGIVEAYKKENEALKDMIDTLTKRGGSNGILEGKYLAQIKKCKTLTVQVEGEKTRTRQLQRDLDEALAKIGQMEEADTTAQARSRKKGKAGASLGGPSPGDGDAVASHGSVDGASAASSELKSLKDRLDRAFQQVRSKDIQLEEMKRENTQLRQLVRQEIGDLDNKDVDALLKRTGSVLQGTTSTSTGASPSGATTVASGGAGGLTHTWRGRAEQIALLKAKVKDLERDLTVTQSALQQAAAAAVSAGAHEPDRIRDDGTCSAAFPVNDADTAVNAFDQADVASWLGLAQGAHSNGGVGTALGSTMASGGGGPAAPVASSTKDYEEVERKHLTELSNQKLLRIRELERQLETTSHQVAEEKRKHIAQQARYQTLQRQHAQLRAHVETMLEKSATDDELIAAYKEEMEAAQQTVRQREAQLMQCREAAWQQAAGGDRPANATAKSIRPHTPEKSTVAGVNRTENSLTTTPTGDQDVAQLRQLVQFYKVESATLRAQLARAEEIHHALSSVATAQAASEGSPLLRVLNTWWAQALASPPVVAAVRHAATPAASAPAPSPQDGVILSAAMAVLLVAHQHVLATESAMAALVDGPSRTLLDVLETYQSLAHKLQQALVAVQSSAPAALTRDVLENLVASLAVVTGRAGADAPALSATSQAQFVKKENAHLRERTRVLADLLEQERQALTVMHKQELKQWTVESAKASGWVERKSSGDAVADASPETPLVGGCAPTAALGSADIADMYVALQSQYNDLRKAFNQLQAQHMKGS